MGGGICVSGTLCVAFVKMLEACLHLGCVHFNVCIDSFVLDKE